MSTLNLGDSLILDTDYSESEVKTGATWIDGKPIYRFCIITEANTKVGGTDLNIIYDATARNIDTFINAEGFMVRATSSSSKYIYPLYSSMSNSAGNGILYSIVPFYRTDTNEFTVRISGNLNIDFDGGKFFIYYTKTTD